MKAYKVAAGLGALILAPTLYFLGSTGNKIMTSSPQGIEIKVANFSEVQGTKLDFGMKPLDSYFGMPEGTYDMFGKPLPSEPKNELGLPSHGVLYNRLQVLEDGKSIGVTANLPDIGIDAYVLFQNGRPVKTEYLNGSKILNEQLTDFGPGTFQGVIVTSGKVSVSKPITVNPPSTPGYNRNQSIKS